MKIKRYFAPDMRTAIRQVKDEQGPDAVILSNKRVDGGIEIIAAVDYDENLMQKAFETDEPVQTKVRGKPEFIKIKTPDQVQPQQTYGVKTIRENAEIKASASTQKSSRESVQWSQDPSIVAMRDELKELRGLLEQQVSRLAWEDMNRRTPVKAAVIKELIRCGFAGDLCERVANQITGNANFERGLQQSLATIETETAVTDDDILSQGGIVALVGPTGVGKTTTVAKLAARFALRHGHRNVALVTTDNFRIGGQEQLLTFGRILNVPVHMVENHRELVETLRMLSDRKLVLIDTAGMSQRDLRLTEQFQTIQDDTFDIKTYLVLSAATQMYALDESVRTFSAVPLEGCILTKLDEATSLGGALSVLQKNDLPVAYTSDGQRVPEDLQPARATTLIETVVQMARNSNSAPDDRVMIETMMEDAAHALV